MNDEQPRTGARGLNASADAAFANLLERFHTERGVGRMALLLAVTFVCFSIAEPGVFLNSVNLQNIGIAAPEIGLLSLAVMISMLTGGIDLSVVSIANGTAISVSIFYTWMLNNHGDGAAAAMTPVILIVGLAVGVGLGLVNGALITYMGITPILATLGTWQVFNGLALVWTDGVTVSGAPDVLSTIGTTTIAGVPLLMIIMVVVAVLLAAVIARTPIGRRVQLQGANPVASRYSGISARSTIIASYAAGGFLCAIAGLFFLSRNPSASADYGSSYVLLVIVIVVLGGTDPNGGFATVLGVVLATLTLQVVSSGFTALRLSAYEYAIAQGAILIGFMVLDKLEFRRRRPATPGPAAPTPTDGSDSSGSAAEPAVTEPINREDSTA